MSDESTILDVESPEARIASRDARIYVLELRVKLLRALLAKLVRQRDVQESVFDARGHGTNCRQRAEEEKTVINDKEEI